MSTRVRTESAKIDDARGTIPTQVYGPADEAPRSLVLISHGTGGTPATHRELAEYLAGEGFAVCVPEHPGNNRNDNSREGTVAQLQERPRDLQTVADWAFRRFPFREQRFSVIGHSIGAYTALALAGGVPTTLPHQEPDRIGKTLDIECDGRIDKLVLLAPAVPWFRQRGSLAAIRVPILMIASYHDHLAPYFVMCPIVQEGVAEASQVDCRLVEGASHYSFLTPPPSLDPPGFDRQAFIADLFPQIAAFLSGKNTSVTAACSGTSGKNATR